MKWTAAQIVQATGGRLLYGAPDQQFSGVGIDSRTIAPGDLFVAIVGESHDGHTFLQQVADHQGRGLLIQEQTGLDLNHAQWERMGIACFAVDDTTRALGALAAFQRRRLQIPVVAITGSNGKTSTRQMTALVMGQGYRTLATEGNFNNEIGLPLTLFRLDERYEAAVLELGMNHPGEIDRLGRIARPTVGVVTNVGPAHLEFLGTLGGVADAKSELLAHIDADGWAVLNGDDDYVVAMAAKAPCRVLYFGTGAGVDIRAEAIKDVPDGIAFELTIPGDRAAVHLKAAGRFMVSNALAAAAAGYTAGLNARQIKAGLERFQPEGGRLNRVETANAVTIIDDTYNANPASTAAAIDSFKVLRGNSRGFIVLGDMLELGDQAEQLHGRVGTLAARSGARKLYAYGPMAAAVLAGARAGGMAESDLFAGSKEEIAAQLMQTLSPGDWLLVKGSRGMAMETVVAAIRSWGDGGAS
jgi:UDP-N-acetylmuramoyl-tripeptide--D-alanyl-D-alanine ligase